MALSVVKEEDAPLSVVGETPAGSMLDSYEASAPQPIKDAVGGIESVGRMLWNVPAGAVAQGLGTLTGLGMGEDMGLASQRGQEASQRVSIPAFTKSGAVADEALGGAYDYVKRDVVTEGLLAIDKKEWNDLKIPQKQQQQLEASHRSLYEGGFDAVMFAGLIKEGLSLPVALEKTRADLLAKKAKETLSVVKEEPAPVDTTKYNQMDLPLNEEPPIQPGTRSPYNLPPEEIARLNQELNPPTEQRVNGQGELPFSPEQGAQPALTPDEMLANKFPTEQPQPSAANRDVYQREADLNRQPMEYGPERSRAPSGPDIPPVPFNEPPISDFGKSGENLAAQRDARTAEAPIPYEPSVFSGPGSKQRGAVVPSVFAEGLKDMSDMALDRLKRGLTVAMERMMDTRDVTGLAVTQRKIDAVNQRLSDINSKKPVDFQSYHDQAQAQAAQVGGMPTPDRPATVTNIFKGPGARQRGAIIFDQAKKDIPRKGVVRTFQDLKKMFLFDKRTLPELMQEGQYTAKDVKDIAPTDLSLRSRLEQGLQHVISNTAIDRTMAILSANKGVIGEIIKNVVDRQNFSTAEARVRTEETITKALRPWREQKKTNPKEIREALDVWQANIGKEELTPTSFKTPKQYEIFKAVNEALTDGVNRMNDARVAAGMKPIKLRPNFFPRTREGEYIVNMFDSTGKLVDSQAFTSLSKANKAHEQFKAAAPEGVEVREPMLQKKGPHDLSSFQAFEETLRALSKDDPMRDAIRKRYAELSGKRGFGKHGIESKDIAGALGFEPGELGVKNASHVLESYIRQQEAYISNLEKGAIEKEIRSLPSDTFDKAPIAKQYLDTYLARARGADLDMMPIIKATSEGISTMMGQGRHGMRNAEQKTSSAIVLSMLVTGKFALAQIPQHLTIMPKMVEMYGLGDLVNNPAKGYFDGWAEALNPDAVSKEARAYAKGRGALESTIVSLLELKLHDLKGEKWKSVEDSFRWALGKEEQLIVRTPVLHMIEKALREQVPNKLERFELATNMMDYYMVHYDRESSPPIYDKLGDIGEVARPLKTYSHAVFGQFFEFAQTVKDTGRIGPLATFMGTQALVGGMKGLVGIGEATAIITLINAQFNQDIPTPLDLMFKAGNWAVKKFGDTTEKVKAISNIADAMIYGGYSKLLGVDVSSTVGSPMIPQMFSMPVPSYTVKAVDSIKDFLLDVVRGTTNEADTMAMWMAVAPPAMRGWVEALYSKEGGNIPNPHDQMRGNFPVPSTAYDKTVRFGLSMKSIDEAKVNAMVGSVKNYLAGDAERKLNALDAIVDRIYNKQKVEPELFQRYIQQGGDPTRLGDSISQRIRDRALDYSTRAVIGGMSLPKIHKLDRMKDLLDEQHKQNLGVSKSTAPLTVQSETPPGQWEESPAQTSGPKKMGLFDIIKPTPIPSKYGDGDLKLPEKMQQQHNQENSLAANLFVSEAKKAYPGDVKKQSEWMRQHLNDSLENDARDAEKFRSLVKHKNVKRMM